MSLFHRDNDIHCKLMAEYPEVPEWWYTILFIISFIAACIVCYLAKFMSWYYLFLVIPIAFIYILPAGIVVANTNQFIDTNILIDFIGGILLLGNPIGFATFKAYDFMTHYQTLNLLLYLKLSHYMKIPPRAMFLTIIIGTIFCSVCSYSIANYLFTTIPNICTNVNQKWSCAQTHYSFSLAILWGAIGPTKIFGKNGLYSSLLWFFLIGGIVPVLFWMATQKYPKIKWFKYVHFPLMCYVAALVPVSVPAGIILSWLIIGFIFNSIIRRWW
ncbi:unnamed protein product [Didymodactylos carnosus]|uniref:Uncharacterized protein n=2 Tax=Didymodactylos carnosus TaxID=1234261 RepID=A0A814I7Z5_9BILA|nr:unnamed protein product [Didymodactylos carnosus]CAF3791367.1 unnamed protein product [Didymodactylos carnosus]